MVIICQHSLLSTCELLAFTDENMVFLFLGDPRHTSAGFQFVYPWMFLVLYCAGTSEPAGHGSFLVDEHFDYHLTLNNEFIQCDIRMYRGDCIDHALNILTYHWRLFPYPGLPTVNSRPRRSQWAASPPTLRGQNMMHYLKRSYPPTSDLRSPPLSIGAFIV